MTLEQLQHLYQAAGFYKHKGYQHLDVPWIVSKEAIDATLPPGAKPMVVTGHGQLVASGEQSLIQLWLDGKLKPGKYSCCTPCFRNESNLSDLTRLYFTKLELMHLLEDASQAEDALDEVLDAALHYHKNWIPDARIEETDIGYDIFCDDVELGSYGYREFREMKWVYGTGCAEPRFSHCHKGSEGSVWK